MEPAALPLGKLEIMKKGVAWVPSPLALDTDKNVLEKWQRLLSLYYIRSGATTIVPGAHTGEFAGGNLEILGRWLGWVREMVNSYSSGGMFLMATVGGGQALKQAEAAARHGYDIVMVAPTAFAGMDDDGAAALLKDIASVIPTFGFELQRAVPGSREYSAELWRKIFEVAYGAKGASFDTYRAQRMLEAAARSTRRDKLVMATGNDDRIVSDLGGVFPYDVDVGAVRMTYSAGLLGHFATDTHAAVRWAQKVVASREGADWDLAIPQNELAHLVNMCNGALFDALGSFENSVWGVKRRLAALGLLPGPTCFHEAGRPGQPEAISRAYAAHPALNDEQFLAENLDGMKREVGLKP